MKEIITDLSLIWDITDKVELGEDYKEIVSELKSTMKKKDLKSLSAPAIGFNKRIFCIKYDLEIKTYINPIIQKADNMGLSQETCSSIPGKQFIIPRYSDLDVIYTNNKGEITNKHLSGMAAYVFQHEIDHLNGVTLEDYGLEIDQDYLEATQEEQQQIIDLYLKSLEDLQEELKNEISEDEDLSIIDEGIKFSESVMKGETKLENLEDIIKQC